MTPFPSEAERLQAENDRCRRAYHATVDGGVGTAAAWNAWLKAEKALVAYLDKHPEEAQGD